MEMAARGERDSGLLSLLTDAAGLHRRWVSDLRHMHLEQIPQSVCIPLVERVHAATRALKEADAALRTFHAVFQGVNDAKDTASGQAALVKDKVEAAHASVLSCEAAFHSVRASLAPMLGKEGSTRAALLPAQRGIDRGPQRHAQVVTVSSVGQAASVRPARATQGDTTTATRSDSLSRDCSPDGSVDSRQGSDASSSTEWDSTLMAGEVELQPVSLGPWVEDIAAVQASYARFLALAQAQEQGMREYLAQSPPHHHHNHHHHHHHRRHHEHAPRVHGEDSDDDRWSDGTASVHEQGEGEAPRLDHEAALASQPLLAVQQAPLPHPTRLVAGMGGSQGGSESQHSTPSASRRPSRAGSVRAQQQQQTSESVHPWQAAVMCRSGSVSSLASRRSSTGTHLRIVPACVPVPPALPDAQVDMRTTLNLHWQPGVNTFSPSHGDRMPQSLELDEDSSPLATPAERLVTLLGGPAGALGLAGGGGGGDRCFQEALGTRLYSHSFTQQE